MKTLMTLLLLAFTVSATATEIAYPTDPTWDVRIPEDRFGMTEVDWPEPAVLAIETRTVIPKGLLKFGWQAWELSPEKFDYFVQVATDDFWTMADFKRATEPYDRTQIPELREAIFGEL
ncbi:MAG: hypothetical protein AAGJ81_10735 [Verrucomicrobiota bacterium]